MAEPSHLEAIRVRREALHQALIGLEDALATPIGDPTRWRLRVAMAVEHAAHRIDDHIRQTESPTGLLHTVVEVEPRLACRTNRLRDDHGELRQRACRLQSAIAALDDTEVEERGLAIRDDALEFMGELVRHRQRGADLIYEAYQVDIGAG